MKATTISFIFLIAVVCSASASALSLQEAKRQGLVGEQSNGYLGIVGTPSAEVTTLVNTINSKRKNAYQGIADKNGTPLDAVEQLAGKKAIGKTPKGQYIQDNSGSWIKN